MTPFTPSEPLTPEEVSRADRQDRSAAPLPQASERTRAPGGRREGCGDGERERGWKVLRSAAELSRFRVWIAFGAALELGLAAASASALTVGGAAGVQVDPVYFNSGGNFGLNLPSGSSFDFSVSPSNFLNVAPRIQINLQTPVLQNPQFPSSSMNPTGPQGTPSQANPFVADSIWTFTNNTGRVLNSAYLVFDSVDLAPTTLLPGGYPDIPVGIDRDLFSIFQYTSPGAKTPLFFGALSLGSLNPNDVKQIRVRYIVAGALPQIGANLVMPPFDLGLFFNVPEPSTFVLLGGGLALCAAAGRRRCA